MTTTEKLAYRASKAGFATIAEYQNHLCKENQKKNLQETLARWERRLQYAEGRIADIKEKLAGLE